MDHVPIEHARGLLDRWMIEVVCSDDPRSRVQSGWKIYKGATLYSTFPTHPGIPFQPSVILEWFPVLSTTETS